jgi:hypothetical protein
MASRSSTATPWRGAGIVVPGTGGGLMAATHRSSSRQPDSSPSTREAMGEPQTKNRRPQRGSSKQTNPQEKKEKKKKMNNNNSSDDETY